jgi:hypothetical protein
MSDQDAASIAGAVHGRLIISAASLSALTSVNLDLRTRISGRAETGLNRWTFDACQRQLHRQSLPSSHQCAPVRAWVRKVCDRGNQATAEQHGDLPSRSGHRRAICRTNAFHVLGFVHEIPCDTGGGHARGRAPSLSGAESCTAGSVHGLKRGVVGRRLPQARERPT